MKCLLKLSFALFFLFGQAEIGMTQSQEFHQVKAKSGDGVYSLLRRYTLNNDPCNVKKFYELNGIPNDAPLLQGKEYILPVYLYTYNGRSIRSTIGIESWKEAVKIKEYNEDLKARGLRKTHYTDSKILWVPYANVNCNLVTGKELVNNQKPHSTKVKKTKNEASKIKTTGKFIYEPLFGKDFANVEIHDTRLKNEVYYVVSGHGGPDPGAQCLKCANTMCEDEYAYDVSLRLARNLMQHGATVHIIIQDKTDGIRTEPYLDCDHDEICMGNVQIPAKQKKRLHQRSNAINRLFTKHKSQGVKKQKAIFIHVDSRGVGKSQDVFFYHYGPSKKSKALCHDLQNTFKKKYNKYQKGRGYKGHVTGRGLYVLRNTYPIAAFVELANIQNANDQERITRPSNRQALANWLFEGLSGIAM